MIGLAEVLDDAPAPAPALARHAADYRVEVSRDWRAVAEWGQGAGTVFQNVAWLTAWYATLAGRAGVTPLLVTARTRDGALALRLPLILRRTGRVSVVEFADLDLTDFNAPLLGPAAPATQEAAEALWHSVCRALPRADFVRLTKLPETVGGRPNPLALLAGTTPCNVNGNVLRIGEDYEAWRFTLDKGVRKEMERCWRVFTREAGARFEMVEDGARARAILAAMEHQQSDRLHAKGEDYALDDPDFAAFYRALVERSLEGGFATLSALSVGDEIVATLLGVRDAHGLVMIRISNAGGRWNNCSPGRLVIERTLRALHAQGCRTFDFSIGNYDYKRRFGVEPVGLVNYTRALRVTGWPWVLKAFASARLRRYPELDRRVRAFLRRPARTKA